MALGGIETVLDIGVENIRAHNLKLMGVALPDLDLSKNGGTICYLAGTRADEIENTLKREKARFDRRGETIRLSLHISNSEEDASSLGRLLNSA